MAYSRYYRSKLTDPQKELYDELLSGMKERKAEIRTARREIQDIQKVFFALNFDNPELYYVNFGNIAIGVSAYESVFRLSFHCDEAAQRVYDKKLWDVVSSIVDPLVGKSMRSGALVLHDWLVTHCTYGKIDTFPGAAHSIIGPFLYSKCVCEGYAKAYKYLADAIGMRCFVVIGKGIHPEGREGGHAWNIVKFGDNCYHIDVTFDSLIAGKYCSRAYYMLSSREIFHDHSVDGSFEIPDCEASGSVLKKVAGTLELLEFLDGEYHKRVTHSEVRLTKGFTREELVKMIENRLTPKDGEWLGEIASWWYGDYSRTLFVCWR